MTLTRLIIFTAFLAWGVMALGAYVRLSDAGLGCPDWPGCYGHAGVPSAQAAEVAFPDRPFEAPKAWKEMVHRYAAGSLGLAILAVFVLHWREKKALGLPAALLALVAFQALLGRWTVTELLKPAIVTAHLLGGMATFAVLVWLAVSRQANKAENVALKRWAALGLGVVALQIFLGGWTSSHYAALICGDGLTCRGDWLPDMDFSAGFSLSSAASGNALTAIHWSHRLGAAVVAAVLGLLGFRLLGQPTLSRFGWLLLGLLALQLALGVANVALGLPLATAVLHNAVAALLLATLVVLNRKLRSEP